MYAVVDVETTGFSKTDRIVEIAIVTLDRDYSVIDQFETLINPECSPGPMHVHGISSSMLFHAPTFPQVAWMIADAIEGKILVAHNLLFDQTFLTREFELTNAKINPGNGLCTMKLTGKKLQSACDFFGVKQKTVHEAMSDAKACCEILKHLAPSSMAKPATVRNVPLSLDAKPFPRSMSLRGPKKSNRMRKDDSCMTFKIVFTGKRDPLKDLMSMCGEDEVSPEEFLQNYFGTQDVSEEEILKVISGGWSEKGHTSSDN